MNLSFLNNFNLAGLGDWGLLLIFLAVAFVYGLAMGRQRVTTIILGSYFSYVLTRAIPWTDLPWLSFKEVPSSTVQIFIFLALVVGFYFLIPYSALRSALRLQGRRKGGWWQAMVLSIAQLGLMLAMVISFLPAKVLDAINPLAQIILAGQVAQFCWLLFPILVLMFVRERHYEVAE